MRREQPAQQANGGLEEVDVARFVVEAKGCLHSHGGRLGLVGEMHAPCECAIRATGFVLCFVFIFIFISFCFVHLFILC